MGQVMNVFFVNMSVMFLLVALTFYFLQRLLPIQVASPRPVRALFGWMNGVTAILLTVNAFPFEEARIDLRLIPIALAATFGGPLGMAVALVVTLSGRALLFGTDSSFIDSIILFTVFFLFSLFISRLQLRRGHAYSLYVWFGSLLVLVRISGTITRDVFMTVFIPYFFMVLIGAWACYWLTKKIETHLWLFRLHQERATIDELTGLPNRYMTLERLNEVEASGRPWTLFVIDLDHFKQLNDTYGHQVGDAALRHIGELFRFHCQTDGFVGRYGGEEFVLILDSECDAAIYAEQLIALVRDRPFTYEGIRIPLRISIGISGTIAEPSQVVFKRADAALYHAKTSGRDQARFG